MIVGRRVCMTAKTILGLTACAFCAQAAGNDTITVDEGSWTIFKNCRLGVHCPAPAPFKFATASGACVSVTDAFLKGDQFEVLDNETLLGTTSPPISDDGIKERDPDLAFEDPTWSSGTFTVGAGSHSIDVQLTGSLAAGPTAAFLRVDSVGSAFCSGAKARKE